ncbi:MAG: hypothetical protein ABJB74_06380 [Gemmatimonas sp.]
MQPPEPMDLERIAVTRAAAMVRQNANDTVNIASAIASNLEADIVT